MKFILSIFSHLSGWAIRALRREDLLQTLCMAVGMIIVFSSAYKSIKFLLYLFRRSLPRNLLPRYGKDSWALVTGASAGIGKGFCEELAKQGFNIVLIANDSKKLEKAVDELQELNPNIKTRVVVAEFFNSPKPGFFDDIYSQIEDLDISILVNNVGMDIVEPFQETSEEKLTNLVTLNTYPMVLLTRKLIKKMRSRKPRSGIINVSSIAADEPLAFVGTYGATKRLNDHFTRSLQIEFDDIDILSLRPCYVSTPMIYYKELSFDTIAPNECALGALRDLGKVNVSYAHWKHDVIAFMQSITPAFISNYASKNFVIPKEMKRRREAAAKLK